MLAELTSNRVIDAAYAWLIRQRRDWPANTDIWHLRFAWGAEKHRLQAALRCGDYRFAPMDRVTKADGAIVHVWCARDALVLKALSMVLAKRLPVSSRCTHVKGHGGAKAAVRAVQAHLEGNAFVMRTDVKGFYDSIDQHRMLEMISRHIKDRVVLNYLWQAMRRSVTWGGLYKDCERGISRGCPLSPLLGAFFLYQLDRTMERSGLFYVRFMDDILVLAPTPWKLRRAVKQVNDGLATLDLEKHPDKTFIGRIEKGFDFLGYRFSRDGLKVAEKTLANFAERLTRLYEQTRNAQDRALRVGIYVRRWLGAVRGGVTAVPPRNDRRMTSKLLQPRARGSDRTVAPAPA